MRLSRTCEYALALIALLALGYWAGKQLVARAYQIVQGREFSRALQAEAIGNPRISEARPLVPDGPQKPKAGATIGSITIPRLGLSSIVVEGAEKRELDLAPGHIPGTSFPGETGNVAIAGHRDTFFRPLRFIRKNDTIAMTTLRGEYAYRVVSTEVVGPDRVQVLYPAKTETLTLITCYPFNFVGPAPRRFVVKAERLPTGE